MPFLSLLCVQVGMDKALNQLSVPLGQLREEVLVKCFSAVVFPVVEISPLFFFVVLQVLNAVLAHVVCIFLRV